MANTLGAKEQEVMSYLHERVFDPILTSSSASDRLKQGIRFTIMRMRERNAAGMVNYYWAAVKGTDPSINFAALMRAEGFNRFEEVLEDFRERFNDRFLLRRR
ncbi:MULTISPECIES: hypothetical protein [Rhizobium]|uniref:hypothetical protein n=1 Tax=Rhizobium TaxID=379 RepID=UPI000380AE91|nr:hypothetical protein [Rhizobium leguminosarum]TBZ81403.1 hypothetical protein E0H61_14805 [Rhizobium leguminosarum bv. viciae]